MKEVLLTLLSELGIGLVASEITQASPLKDKSAHLGETTAGRARLAVNRVEEDLTIGNTAGGIESDGESVGKAGCLLEKGINLLGVASEALVRALEQIVACASRVSTQASLQLTKELNELIFGHLLETMPPM